MNPLIQFKNMRVLLPLIASVLVAGAFTPAAAAPQPQYTVIDLGEGVGNVITDSGQIVGTKPFHGDAAFWPSPQSPAIDLGTLPGFTQSRGLGINPRGQMVGAAFPASSARPLFWASSSSHAVILSTTGQYPNGTAEGINDIGRIVGTAYDIDLNDSHAFVWPNSNRPGVDLNTLIPSDSGWELQIAHCVNNRGEITGYGFLNGIVHAYALIPVHGPR